MDGVVESLVQRYLYEATYSSTSSIARESRRRRGSELGLLASGNVMGSDLNRNRRKYLKKAEQASEGVRCDIQVLVGITDVSLPLCFLCLSLWRDIFEGSAA